MKKNKWNIDKDIKQIVVEVRGDANKPEHILIQMLIGDEIKEIAFKPERVDYITDSFGFVYKSHGINQQTERSNPQQEQI